LPARVQALRRRFIEHYPWEEAASTLKDPNRVPDAAGLLSGAKRSPTWRKESWTPTIVDSPNPANMLPFIGKVGVQIFQIFQIFVQIFVR